MRSSAILLLICLSSCLGIITCVDPAESTIKGSLNVLIVDGTITDVAEPQVIRINRSQTDRLTGHSGYSPVTKAIVELLIDSSSVVVCTETADGVYELPSGFKGQVGHTYKLRFTLSDGEQYESIAESLPPVAPIARVRAQFNPASLASAEQLNGVFAAAHDFYVDFTDPADQANYYRWEWIDWERQDWCRSCHGGRYQITDSQGKLVDDCVNERITYAPFDYNCRTQCWEILHGNKLVLFKDDASNGRLVKSLRVAQIPLYSKEHCLVEIRQQSLTQKAHAYYKQLDDQTRNAGGVASAQPAVLVGNIHNSVRGNEPVVGYFTVSSVASFRYWLNRSDAIGFAPGLYQALNGHDPTNEPAKERFRPPLAVCVPSYTRTPVKPQGWQD